MHSLRRSIYILFAFSLLLFVSGCDEDNPVEDQEDHFEAEGLLLKNSGILIADIFQGVTDDTLIAPEGAISDHMDVTFYNSGKQEINPPDDSDKELIWVIDDTDVAEVWQHPGEEGGYEIHLRGLEEGETHIEFFISHNGHNDFRSGKFPVRVEHQDGVHGEPVGLFIKDEDSGNTLVTWASAAVTGSLSVNANDSTDHMEVEFYDANDVEFQPDASEHSITITSQNTSIVEITGLEPAEPYAFKIRGVASGSTTITIELLHDGSVEKTYADIPVTVN